MSHAWTIWQLADSAFPSGGFTHSAGLEAAWRHGAWPEGSTAQRILGEVLRQTAHSSLPLINAVIHDIDCFRSADCRAEAVLSNHVARRASVAQGRALLTAAPRIFESAQLQRWCRLTVGNDTPGHLAPVFGGVMQFLNIDPTEARRLFLYTSMRDAASAGIRLGRIGPIESQAVLASLAVEADRLADGMAEAGLDDTAQTMPLLELMQANQDRLYSRLFQS
jgi:urease accessory protein